jgi:pantothenate kinase type III
VNEKTLAVDLGNSALKLAWIGPGETRDLVELQREGLAVISDLTRVETV